MLDFCEVCGRDGLVRADAPEQPTSGISVLAFKGIARWGAGHIFDSRIGHGGFDPSKFRTLIDTHLVFADRLGRAKQRSAA